MYRPILYSWRKVFQLVPSTVNVIKHLLFPNAFFIKFKYFSSTFWYLICIQLLSEALNFQYEIQGF